MEGYILVDNGRLTEKEARLNMEQCADFLSRMIQKYGPEILAEHAAFCAAERTPVRLPADTWRRQRTAA